MFCFKPSFYERIKNPLLNMIDWVFGLYGGGDDEPPAPPSARQQAEEAIQAQISNLPSILKAQQQYGPQFAEEAVKLQEQFGPRYLESMIGLEEKYGPKLAEITRAEQGVLAPERVAGQNVLADYLSQEQLLTPQEEQQARADLRAATSVRGLGESGEAALEELRALTSLRQQLKAQRLNIALSAAGAIPTTGTQTVAAPGISQGQLVSNITPAQSIQAQQQAFEALLNQYNNRPPEKGGIAGALGGAVTGATAGSAAGPWGTFLGAVGGGVGGYFA